MVVHDMDTWEVRYSKYVGDLSVFNKDIYAMKAEELRSDQIEKDIFVTINSLDNRLMMVEVKDADRKIAGIDKMNKDSIINIVKECIA